MAFSCQTVTGSFPGQSGSVTFTLTEEISNAGMTLVAGVQRVAALDASGNVSAVLTSTLDPGTASQGNPSWRCDERLVGLPETSWFFSLPPGPGTVDLSTLRPQYDPDASQEAG